MAASFQCDVHPGRHVPLPLETDQHHVIPRAWQAVFVPAAPPFPGTYQGVTLWDARTAAVPPTCHRNVHHWIVALMHLLAVALADGGDERAALDRAAKSLTKGLALRGRATATQELACAKLAPSRFLDAGGDLKALIAAGQWGEA